MKVKYMKYKQAVSACLQYQSLKGQPFDKEREAAGTVRHVLIAPYSRILQWHFLSSVFAGKDPSQAIAVCRDGKYDVVVISSKYNPADDKYKAKPLRDYLEEFALNSSVEEKR
jgi:hypothetical protein